MSYRRFPVCMKGAVFKKTLAGGCPSAVLPFKDACAQKTGTENSPSRLLFA